MKEGIIMSGNAPIAFVTFHKNATTVEDGLIYNVGSNANILNIDFVTTNGTTNSSVTSSS